VGGSGGPPAVVLGTGTADFLATMATFVEQGATVYGVDCLHDAACLFDKAQSVLLGRSGNSCAQPMTFSRAQDQYVAGVRLLASELVASYATLYDPYRGPQFWWNLYGQYGGLNPFDYFFPHTVEVVSSTFIP